MDEKDKSSVKRLRKWRDKARTIANYYGKDHQMLKLVEECGELIEALMHNRDGEKKSKKDVAGELADVAVLIPQVANLLGIEDLVVGKIEYKYDRQMKRIRQEIEGSSDKTN